MSFKRLVHPPAYAENDQLTSDLVGIGIRLAAPAPEREPNIENTLVAASIAGVMREDFRLLALLVDWLGIHVSRVNVDRLTKLVAGLPQEPVKAFWAGIAHWHRVDPRMKKLFKLRPRRRVDLFHEGGEFLIQRNGEDERFASSPFRVAAGTLRHRPADIFSAEELARRHSDYHWRVVIGPSYRADMFSLLSREPNVNCAVLARRTYGSYPTAFAVKADWRILRSQILELLPTSQ